MYRPGELDQRLEFFTRTESDDGYGGRSVSFVSKGSSWCKVKPLSGKEIEKDDQVQDTFEVKFVIRNRQDLSETDLIRWSGNDYNIKSMPPRGDRVLYLEIIAVRGVAQ